LKVTELSREISEVNEERMKLKAKWQNEKKIIEEIQQQKRSIEDFKSEADQAERQGNYGLVAEIRYGRIKEAEKKIAEMNAELINAQGDSAMINEEVSSEDIAEIISNWTGIPVRRMLQGEREKLLKLEQELHKRWWVRMKPLRQSLMLSEEVGQDCRIRNVHWLISFSGHHGSW